MLFVIFISSNLICVSRVSSVLQYEITAVALADTEKYVPYTNPPNEDSWLTYDEDARNLGLTFAGKAEFSWIVDLRLHREDQEFWSTGNLYSSEWVLTTCKAQILLEQAWRMSDRTTKEITGGAVVTFFQLYYWEFVENDNWHDYQDRWAYGGSRRIEKFFRYPGCDMLDMKYDGALLKLKDGINPVSPFIGYMPYLKDPSDSTGKRFADYDLSAVESRRSLCFVGSVGRNYYNWNNHLVLDFKVRFRVYYESFANCTSVAKRLCDSSRHRCREAFPYPRVRGREWVCMRTRARVGTVCDHDRGAPVVCDDEVVGMVAYGALFRYCNDRIPLPFVVVKLHSFSEWTNAITGTPQDEPWT